MNIKTWLTQNKELASSINESEEVVSVSALKEFLESQSFKLENNMFVRLPNGLITDELIDIIQSVNNPYQYEYFLGVNWHTDPEWEVIIFQNNELRCTFEDSLPEDSTAITYTRFIEALKG